MRKIVIHDVIHQDALDLMAARNDVEVVSVAGDDRAGVLREIADAAGVILRYLPLDREAIEAARDLQIIARHGVGYDNVDIEAASAAGIPVATIGDANALTVAELTLYFMLAAAKQGPVHDAPHVGVLDRLCDGGVRVVVGATDDDGIAFSTDPVKEAAAAAE